MLEVFKGILGNFMVDSDGRRAVGRSINNHADSQRGEELKVINYNPNIQQALENDYEILMEEASLRERQKKEYEKKLKHAKHRYRFLKKTATTQIIAWGAIGMYAGMVIAVDKVLMKHGPTVTILGTIGACLLYLLAGAIGAAIMGCLCKIQAKDFIRYEKSKVRAYRKAIRELESEITEIKDKASHYYDRAWRQEAL